MLEVKIEELKILIVKCELKGKTIHKCRYICD